MASKRGSENIRKFNADRGASDLILVEHELQLCRKRKLQFKTPGLLATYLSDVTKIHRTTFGRNVKYKKLIAVYMSTQPGAATIVDDGTDDPWVLKAKLAATQAELGNLRQELNKLRAEHTRLKSADPITIGGNDSEVDFSNVCVMLAQVLTRAETFQINTKDGTLVDLAARPSDQIVASASRVSAFIRWIQINEYLPYVKSIRKT